MLLELEPALQFELEDKHDSNVVTESRSRTHILADSEKKSLLHRCMAGLWITRVLFLSVCSLPICQCCLLGFAAVAVPLLLGPSHGEGGGDLHKEKFGVVDFVRGLFRTYLYKKKWENSHDPFHVNQSCMAICSSG